MQGPGVQVLCIISFENSGEGWPAYLRSQPLRLAYRIFQEFRVSKGSKGHSNSLVAAINA